VTRATFTNVAAGALILLLCARGDALEAQQPSPTPPQPASAAPRENPAKLQAFRFEAMLRTAIEMAGQRLAQQARLVAPDLTLQVSEAAVARGVKLSAYGFYFDVQAPDITSQMIVWDMQRGPRPQNARAMTPVSGGAEQPTSSSTPVVNFDPDQAYTTYVKEALIDSVLDDSSALTIAPTEFLTVAVSGIDPPTPNVLYRRSIDKLVLTIRGADLIDFRQGRITREQAKERMTQERF
jgi:hypothetical protein